MVEHEAQSTKHAACSKQRTAGNYHNCNQYTKTVDNLGLEDCGEDDVRGDEICSQGMADSSRYPAAAALLRRSIIAHTTGSPGETIA